MDFILASKKFQSLKTNLNLIYSNNEFCFYADPQNVYKKNDLIIYISGFIIPRHFVIEEFKNFKSHELIDYLFKKYNQNFIDYIKGNFCVVLVHKDEAFVLNDIHSISRFYYWNSSDEFLVSNSFRIISENIRETELNKKIFALMALFQHQINGETLLKNVIYSEGATIIKISNKFRVDTYWNIEKFTKEILPKKSLDSFIKVFNSVIKDYIEYFDDSNKNILLTLTGGRDTRSILTSLLNNKIRPTVFTFGDPQGLDVVTSKRIADQLKLDFHNPYIEELNGNVYGNLVNEIIDFENQFIHLHRAHRLDAIKQEKKILKSIDTLFMGAMGGDYIKGVSFNDYIISEFVRRYLFENKKRIDLISEILDKHFVVYDNDLLYELELYVKNLDFINKDDFKVNELLLAYKLIGCTHDIQDINIFSQFADKVILPFMDVDIIESLFQTDYSLLSNNRASKNILKKISGGELQARLILSLYPILGDIPFANQYTAKEVLMNKYLYLLKRIYKHFFKVKRVQTFPYGSWFFEYVDNNLNSLNSKISDYYDLAKMKKALNVEIHSDKEGYWHKFTNPIFLSNYYKKFFT